MFTYTRGSKKVFPVRPKDMNVVFSFLMNFFHLSCFYCCDYFFSSFFFQNRLKGKEGVLIFIYNNIIYIYNIIVEKLLLLFWYKDITWQWYKAITSVSLYRLSNSWHTWLICRTLILFTASKTGILRTFLLKPSVLSVGNRLTEFMVAFKNLHDVNAAQALFALQASLSFNTLDHNDIWLEKKTAPLPSCLE